MPALPGLHQEGSGTRDQRAGRAPRRPDPRGGLQVAQEPREQGGDRPEPGIPARDRLIPKGDRMSIQAPAMRKIAEDVKLGEGVKIYDFVNLYGCEIGDNTKIGTFVEIQKKAKIGRNCKISSHTFICEGVTIEDDVFIGHNVTFINDTYPRATAEGGGLQTEADWVCISTFIKKGASIGSSVTVLAGVTVGERAIVGAGSVVTKDVPPDTIV